MSGVRSIRGLENIATRLGRDTSTVRRWIDRGVLAAAKGGPFTNSPLIVTVEEIERIRRQYQIAGEE